MSSLATDVSTTPIPESDYYRLLIPEHGLLSMQYRYSDLHPAQQTSSEPDTTPRACATSTAKGWGVDESGRWIRSQLLEIRNEGVATILRSVPRYFEGDASRPVLNQIGFETTWGRLCEKLDSCSRLIEGWDGYAAHPPAAIAISRAYDFMSVLRRTGLRPSRLKPSVVGGIGVTFRKGPRKGYVEFYNDGNVHVLFSDSQTEPLTRRVPPTSAGYDVVIQEIREYLNG